LREGRHDACLLGTERALKTVESHRERSAEILELLDQAVGQLVPSGISQA
jgi:hypothetical protein